MGGVTKRLIGRLATATKIYRFTFINDLAFGTIDLKRPGHFQWATFQYLKPGFFTLHLRWFGL